MSELHPQTENHTIPSSKEWNQRTKAKKKEQVSDLDFGPMIEGDFKPADKELHMREPIFSYHKNYLQKHLLLIVSITVCTIIVITASLITKNFINQTGRTTKEATTIIAQKTPETTPTINSSLWYGNYSGAKDVSSLTITKNEDLSFNFSVSVKEGENQDTLTGTADITSYNTATYKADDGYCLYFTLSNGVVTLTKDAYCYDRHAVSFSGSYINTDGNADCYSTRYFNTMRSFGSDTAYQLDINKDGKPDSITYKSGILTINKQSYNFMDESANLDLDSFHVIDIDSKDEYINLLVMDDGPSCDPVTTVVTYTKSGKITTSSLGCNVNQLTFNNSGIIEGCFRFNLLQTWYGACQWRFENNQVQFIDQDYYTPVEMYTLGDDPIASNQRITLYQKDSLKSKRITLEPQKIKFVKTDNIHWVQVLGLKDNTEGWLYLKDYNEVPDEGQTAEDLFDNLILAD